jgi:hypothetical protein
MIKFIDILKNSVLSEIVDDNIAIRVSDYHWKDRKSNLTPSGYYPGVYFYTGKAAEDKVRDNKFAGKNVYKLDITGANLYKIDSPKKAEELKDEAEKAAEKGGFIVTQGSGYGDVEYLKSKGYDGIKRGIEVILFEPEKFKEL